MRANCRRSAEIDKIDGSSKERTYGPSTIPVSSMPRSGGNLSLENKVPNSKPHRKIRAKLVSLGIDPFAVKWGRAQKKPMTCPKSKIGRSHQLFIQRFWSGIIRPGENFIPRYIPGIIYTILRGESQGNLKKGNSRATIPPGKKKEAQRKACIVF